MTDNDALSSAPRGLTAASKARFRIEIVIVLGLSLGMSGLRSLLSLLKAELSPTPLSEQTQQLNPQLAEEGVWDAIYRVLSIVSSLMLVALVLYLLWEPGRRVFQAIGLDFTKIGSDVARALAIGACIGIPGLGLYVLSRTLGYSQQVQTSDEATQWWIVVLLVLSAVRAGLLEEVIMLGWFFDRFRRLGVGPVATIVASAAIRASYHAYQGYAGLIGNFVMGLVFGWLYRKWGRVMPLVIAHTLIDIVAFTGYPLARALLPAVF